MKNSGDDTVNVEFSISFGPGTCDFVLYFGAESSSKQGQNSNQNRGHLGFMTCWL